jgi:predicted alpha/beta superfamily hydrolase
MPFTTLRRRSSFILLVIFLLLSGCGDGGSKKPQEALKGSIEPETRIKGNHNGVNYPLMVYLPEHYGDDPDASYPLLLILDAEWNFEPIIKIVDSMGKNIIVVGVGNANGTTGQYQRGIDYPWPGASDYYNFLTLQVLPYVEAIYSVDPTDRTLSGHSFGGLFTGFALLLEQPNNRYFAKYFSQDGSFWKDTNIISSLEQQLYDDDKDLAVQLILSGATINDGNATDVKWFYNKLKARNYNELDLLYLENNVDHITDIVVSMKEALDFLYP